MNPALTLVVTLRGRPAFTARWLRWAIFEKIPFPVLLADGSLPGDAAAHEKLAAEASRAGINVNYIRYSADAAYPDYYAKLADAFGRVRTPFAALVDNDDFPIASGLTRCVEFLNAEPAWVACGGLVAGLSLERETGPWGGLYGRRYSIERRPGGRDLDAHDPAARVRVQLRDYRATWYDVVRAEVQRDIYLENARCALQDLFLMELLTSLLLAAAGKIKRADSLILVRQYDAEGASSDAARGGGAIARMLLPTWSEDFGRLLDTVSGRLARAGVDAGAAREMVSKGFHERIERASSPPARRARLRSQVGRGLSAVGLGAVRALVGRKRAAAWAGRDGGLALSRLADFLSTPPEAE